MSVKSTNAPLADVPLNEAAAQANQNTESSPASMHSETLHQGEVKHDLEAQRALLQQKLAAKQGTFVSPTDNMMSPCTAKLQAHKKKQFGKTKPQLLQKAFAQVAAKSGEQENKPNKIRKDDSIF